jgi:hypothetical protein
MEERIVVFDKASDWLWGTLNLYCNGYENALHGVKEA